jgi:MurNAc alpha-1-phosphate uridylyltransferase
MIKQAMIFAAGMGKRMLPLTETTPKPLVKINQDSLLVNNIKKLIKSNFNSIVINTFHFPEKIIAEVKDYKNHVKVVIEEERLETGGGLLNCLKKKNLSWESPILLLNSDVYWIDNFHSTIELILENWNPEFMDLVLCMKKKKEFYGYSGKGDFNLYKKNLITKS